MEFVEATSSKVTDITIPEGNVIKIEEAATGRVLWEKASLNINPSWTRQDSTLINPHQGPTPIYIIAREKAMSGYKGGYTLFTTTLSNTGNNSLECFSADAYVDSTKINRASYADTGNGYKLRFIAATKDTQPNGYNNNKPGLLLMYYGLTNTYGFVIRSNLLNYYQSPFLSIDSQPNGQIYITLAADRDEFLITGLSAGSLILPTSLNSSTPVNFDSSSSYLLRTCRVPDLELYFATSRVTKRSLYYSSDGISWNGVFPFLSGDVLGVEYISEKKLICAVSSTESKIALSADGITWTERNAPFTNALAFDYAPEYNLFCVVDNKAAYLTQNFYKWITAPLPNNTTFEFTNLLYTCNGVFLGHKYGGSDIYILFTDNILPINNPYFSS